MAPSVVPELRQPYYDAVTAFAAPVPSSSCSVYLYGSAQWGDCTILRDGRPVSDIDLIVVGESIDDLRKAALHLSDRFAPFRRADAPLFKLGLKLRTRCEVAERKLTINDVTALLWGRLLSGPPIVFPQPSARWFERQARLVVPMRRECTGTQRKLINVLGKPLERYLAARTLLDIPTLLIRSPDDVRGGYRERVARFPSALESIAMPDAERRAMVTLLQAALLTKMAPEGHECGTVEEAEQLLRRFAAWCGVVAAPGQGRSFWQAHRPLDVRDWQLRQTAL